MKIKASLFILLAGLLTGCAAGTAGGQPAGEASQRSVAIVSSAAAESGIQGQESSDAVSAASSDLSWTESTVPTATDGTFRYELQFEE